VNEDLKRAAEAYRATPGARRFAALAAGAEDRIWTQLELATSDHEHAWGAWYSLSRATKVARRYRPDEDLEDEEAGEDDEDDDDAWVTACVHCGIARPR
jgi:hypothetical protein